MSGDFLQNMAPNAKRSFFVTLVLASVAVALYVFGVEPAESQLARTRAGLDSLESQQMRMNANLHRADLVNKDLKEVRAKLEPYGKVLLTPLLESYAMRAKSILDPFALGAGLSNVNYAEEPSRALPLPTPLPRQLHRRAAIRITATGSYQAAVSFLLRVERELPHVSVQSFAVKALRNPDLQSVSFVLEWPALGGLTRK